MKNVAPVLLAILVGAVSGLLGALWPRGDSQVQPLATATVAAPSRASEPGEVAPWLGSAAPASQQATRIELALFCQHRAAPGELIVRRLVQAGVTRSWSAPSGPTLTDAQGRAVLPLTGGIYLLTARSAGCGTLNQSLEVKHGLAQQSVELQLGLGVAIWGAVRDATTQQPLGGALVQLQQELGLHSRQRELSPIDDRWTVVTDSLGRYRIEGLGSGDFVVRASAGGFADGKGSLTLATADGRADLLLEGAGTIEGRLLHAIGAATVKALRDDSKTVFANADGSFRLSVGPGEHLLLGEDSSGATGLVRVHVTAKSTVGGVELALNPGGRIRGRAMLGGAPATCARVWVRAESDPYEIASAPVAADGAFVLERVPAGRYWLLGECPDGEHGDVLGVEPNRDPVELSLKQAAGLSGRVVDASGQPVAGAEIEVSQPQREPVLAVSDGQGRFELSRLIVGVVTVEATARTRVSDEHSIQLAEGQDLALELVVRATTVITGRIDGARELVKRVGAWSPGNHRGADTQLGADGTYTLNVVPGHYRVVPWLSGAQGMIVLQLGKELDAVDGRENRADFIIPKAPIKPMEASAPGTIGASFDDGPGGVTICWVISDSPGARAGLQVGDLLLALDGKPVARSVEAFARANGAPESKVRISYRRGGADQEVVVTRAGD